LSYSPISLSYPQSNLAENSGEGKSG